MSLVSSFFWQRMLIRMQAKARAKILKLSGGAGIWQIASNKFKMKETKSCQVSQLSSVYPRFLCICQESLE